jgi:hypothetical protein
MRDAAAATPPIRKFELSPWIVGIVEEYVSGKLQRVAAPKRKRR